MRLPMRRVCAFLRTSRCEDGEIWVKAAKAVRLVRSIKLANSGAISGRYCRRSSSASHALQSARIGPPALTARDRTPKLVGSTPKRKPPGHICPRSVLLHSILSARDKISEVHACIHNAHTGCLREKSQPSPPGHRASANDAKGTIATALTRPEPGSIPRGR